MGDEECRIKDVESICGREFGKTVVCKNLPNFLRK